MRRRNDNPERLLEAVGQNYYGPLIQFALTVAGNDDPLPTLAAARCFSHDAGEGHVRLRCRV